MPICEAFLGVESAREVAQALVAGIIAGSGYAMLGAALALIYGVTRRFHFALASTYMLTAVMAAIAIADWGLPLLPAALIGLIAGTVAGVAIEAFVYRPLAHRSGEGALLTVFVASLGIVIAVENLVREIWGSNTRNLPGFPESHYTVSDVNATLSELCQVGAAVVLIVGLALLLKRTVLGQQIRAVRGNPDMAPAVGVNVRLIFLIVFALGSFVAGVAAVFDGIRFAVTPAIGEEPIFYAFVVTFLAGASRSPLVVGAVGLGIGVVQSVSTLWMSENLSAVTVFGLLFIFLAVRSVPDGLRRLSGALSRSRPITPRASRA
jgi:branched-chain amino acid transport system permease protein